MKKLYSTSNLVKAVSLGTVMTALLSSVSPVFAANFAFTGGANLSTSGAGVAYRYGSHGSVVLAGDDNFCGADTVIGRGGKQQESVASTDKITAEQQYNRFITDQKFGNRNPYGTTTEQVIWGGNSVTTPRGGYMGALTGGVESATPEAYGVYSFATGCGSAATGNYSTVFGAGATAKAGGAQAFGVSALAAGKASVAMGVGSEASGESTVAIGGLATASGKNSIALGVRSQATLDDAIAFGSDATASGINSVAIGKVASASGYDSIALGLKTKATDEYAVAIGTKAEAQALGSIAIGGGEPADNGEERKVIAKGKNSIAIGTHTYAETAHSVAIGINAQVRVIDGVAVGGGSVSRVDGKVLGYDPVTNTTTTKSDLAWKSTAGDFSVGNTNQNLTRQITNVAAGSKDTDAVNVAQLKAMRDVIAGGGTWQISANDKDPTEVKAGNTVDFSVKSEKEEGKDNLKIERNTTENKHKIEFTLSDTLTLTQVTTGQSKMSDDGFFVNGENGSRMTVDGFFINGNDGPSMTIDGIDAAKKKIINVAEGTEDTDAVNYKQLKAIQEATKTSWQLAVNGGNATAIGPNGTVNFQSADNEGTKNIKITKDNDHNVTFDLADDIQVKTVTAGESVMSAVGFGFTDGNGPSITVNGIHAGDKTIKGVAAGENDTDAVNYKQLKDFTAGMATGWKLSVDGNNATDVKAGSTVNFVAAKQKDDDNNESENTNIKITKGDNNEVKFDLSEYIKVGRVETGDSRMSNAGFMIKDGPNMTKGGIFAANTKITGVQKGTNENDAVNVSQLNEIKDQIVDNSLVKWHEDQKLITIGAQKDGIEINVANNDDENRIISGVAVGKVSSDSTEAINGHQLFNYADNISKYFGGETDVIDGFKPTFTVQKTKHNNVTGAFAAVDSYITDIYSQINNVASNSLVQWDEGEKLITIGKEKGGTKIDITGTEGARTIAGVKAAENDDEAVNKKQLDDTVTNINNNVINQMDKFAVLYDKNDDNSVNYNSVTLGGNKINGQVALHNVKDGKISDQSHDAINGSQINKISQNVAEFFGGGTSFENGVFRKPRYNLTTIDENGQVKQQEHNDVGSALSGLDTNIRHVNHHLVLAMKDVASYFGGGAGYDENGEWHAPTFKVYQINDNGAVSKKSYDNVADAFEGVNNTFTNIHNQISDITKNSLVKQEGEDGLITIGKATGGTEISIVNKSGMDRTLSGVKDGTLSQTSTEAVNGSQLFKTNENVTTVTNDLKTVAQNTSKYFGGSTDVLNGVEPTFLIQDTKYNSVFDAFTGVNISIHKIDDKISDVVKNSLVKQDGGVSAPITIGKDTAGTEINIAGSGKLARKISGVRAAENGDEAVNKDQLDKSIDKISKDIETVTAAAVLYDKNDDGNVNYGSVTLGGDKNNGPVALHNVKDGSISENSHDAINGSQINKISADIAKFFGGGAKFINGAFKGLKYTLSAIVDGKVGQANFYDVGSALTGLDKNVQDVNKRLTNVSNEFNQKIENFSKDALLWDDDEEAFVARHEKDGQKTKSKLKYLLDGEIADGSTDAITGNQLYFMSNKLANYFGGGAKYENGKWTDPTFKIVQVNADGTTVEKEHHNVADAFGDINNGMSNINNRIDDVINKVDTDALKWNDKEKAYDAGRDGKPSKIINVADGKIEKGSKDAVNGGQLWETNERVTGVEKDVKHLTNRVDNISTTVTDIGKTVFNIENKVDNIDNKVNDIAEDAVRYDRDENGKKTNKITLAGGDPSEPVMIDNVADGKIEKGSKEAVNGGQLHDYTQEQMKIILDESKHYTDQRINNIRIDAIDDAVDRAKQYTDMKFDVLNYSIESVKKEARQAAAIGLAVSNLRYNDTPGKLSVGFGTGLWRSQSAFAFGAGYTSENGKYRSNISATTSGGHWGVGAGFNMTLN
ncbi:Vomp family autotransporter [Bartonella sp. MR30HLJHH]|uniref:Vomp family autotransporter n=1 Tax=Bartonella sp. MR30HLJHH TaxID=3243557 RepID=UPI0035D107B8